MTLTVNSSKKLGMNIMEKKTEEYSVEDVVTENELQSEPLSKEEQLKASYQKYKETGEIDEILQADMDESKEEFGTFMKKFIQIFGVAAVVLYVVVMVTLFQFREKSSLISGVGMATVTFTYIVGIVFCLVILRKK